MPDFLYKYRSMAQEKFLDWLEQTVVHSQIYLCSPKLFNDPFDCRPYFKLPRRRKKRIKIISAAMRRLHPTATAVEIRNLAENFLNAPDLDAKVRDANERLRSQEIERIGVYSLSAVKDSTLMFSHYGDSHRGICLEFNIKDKKHWGQVRPMRYSRRYPQIVWSPNLSSADLRKIFHWKDAGWKYEKEYRLVDNQEGLVAFPEQHLSGIIFGCAISDDHKDLVRRWVSSRRHPLQLYQAVIHPSQYRLLISKTI